MATWSVELFVHTVGDELGYCDAGRNSALLVGDRRNGTNGS